MRGQTAQTAPVFGCWVPSRRSRTFPVVPSAGDLYIVMGTGGVPAPPAGTQPGDGFVYDGATWDNIGPIRGPAGQDGTDGAPGAVGPTGPQGPKGDDGDVSHVDWIVGKVTYPTGQYGPTGIQPAAFYINELTGEISQKSYGYASPWSRPVSIMGPPGPSGADGAVPIGTIIDWGGDETTLPAGFTPCDIRLEQVTGGKYDALYNAIKYTWNKAYTELTGNPVPGGFFAIPPLNGRVTVGKDGTPGDQSFQSVGDVGGHVDAKLVDHQHSAGGLNVPDHAHTVPKHYHTIGKHYHTASHTHDFTSGPHDHGMVNGRGVWTYNGWSIDSGWNQSPAPTAQKFERRTFARQSRVW